MEASGNGNNIPESTPVDRAFGRLNVIKLFFYACLKYLGLFLLGIFVGMGIVLKNPMPSKKSDTEVNTKKVENLDSMQVKRSVYLN